MNAATAGFSAPALAVGDTQMMSLQHWDTFYPLELACLETVANHNTCRHSNPLHWQLSRTAGNRLRCLVGPLSYLREYLSILSNGAGPAEEAGAWRGRNNDSTESSS